MALAAQLLQFRSKLSTPAFKLERKVGGHRASLDHRLTGPAASRSIVLCRTKTTTAVTLPFRVVFVASAATLACSMSLLKSVLRAECPAPGGSNLRPVAIVCVVATALCLVAAASCQVASVDSGCGDSLQVAARLL
jgi:hypothetical protein